MFALNFNSKLAIFAMTFFANGPLLAGELKQSCAEVQVYGQLQIQKDEMVLVLNDKSYERQAYSIEFSNFSEGANLFALQDQYVVAAIDSFNAEKKTVHLSAVTPSRKDFSDPQGPQQTQINKAFECQNKRSMASEKQKKINKKRK